MVNLLVQSFVYQALGNEWHPESNEYCQRLSKEGYTTLPMCLTMTEDDLKFCGIEKRAHLRSFVQFIQRLTAREDEFRMLIEPPRASSLSMVG
jgi:hypothetical protein